MGSNKRQRLVSMVRGESWRIPLFRFRFGNETSPSGPEFLDRVEVEKFVGMDSYDGDLFLFGCRPEHRAEVLRTEPCLVRRDDGRFVAINPEKGLPRFLID